MRAGPTHFIFDLGSGVRELGAATKEPFDAQVFVSHYHYDHLQGLPFFGAMFDPRSRFTVRGPTRADKTVKDVITGQMQQPFFPVTAEMVFRAQLDYRPFEAGDRLRFGDAQVSAIEANHPGGNLLYRVDYHGRSIVYATDHEHGERDRQLINFAQGADLLIYDCMYTDDEYLGRFGGSKAGWGHSTWQSGVRIARAAKCHSLVLFHHEPTRTDSAMDALVRTVKRQFKSAIAAREGLCITY